MMAEKNSKPDDKANNMPDTEQPVTDSPKETQLETSTAAPRKKKRVGPWIFLLLVFVGLPAAWLFSPAELRQQAVELLNAGKAHLQSIQATHPTSPPVIESQVQTADSAPGVPATGDEDSIVESVANTSDVISEPSVDMVATTPVESVSPAADTTASLQEEINRLQGELSNMQSERDELTRQIQTEQTIELRIWLSLLASPDTRLSQRKGMWSYLASLPSLDESEQGKAGEMAALLQQAGDRLTSLRASLKQLAESIPVAQQNDIIPKPENPYLAWLLSAFHLRPAPGANEVQKSSLRKQLRDMEHALSIQDWPEPSAWRQLLNAVRDQLSDSADSGLSESMDNIRINIDVSRKAASDWMGAL